MVFSKPSTTSLRKESPPPQPPKPIDANQLSSQPRQPACVTSGSLKRTLFNRSQEHQKNNNNIPTSSQSPRLVTIPILPQIKSKQEDTDDKELKNNHNIPTTSQSTTPILAQDKSDQGKSVVKALTPSNEAAAQSPMSNPKQSTEQTPPPPAKLTIKIQPLWPTQAESNFPSLDQIKKGLTFISFCRYSTFCFRFFMKTQILYFMISYLNFLVKDSTKSIKKLN